RTADETPKKFQSINTQCSLIQDRPLDTLPSAYKHPLLQFSRIANYDESDWTTECESP
ncbi:hypothetical protein AVEN_148431-1, partial [Araneus ventricosus]